MAKSAPVLDALGSATLLMPGQADPEAAIGGTVRESSCPPCPPASQQPSRGEIPPFFVRSCPEDSQPGPVHEEAGARSATASLLDLIELHNSGTPPPEGRAILLKTEVYPSGAIRAVVRQVSVETVVAQGGTPLRAKRAPEEQERRGESVDRTKRTIRERCMAFNVDRLVTLTYRANQTDRELCYRHTAEFIEQCRRVNLLPQYVAVPEQQQRGAWHVHIACRGYMPVITLRRIWRQVVGGLEGNIDMSYHRRGRRSPWRIASYLSKYIGKAVGQCPAGVRTFWASNWSGKAPTKHVVLFESGTTLTQVHQTLLYWLIRWKAEGRISHYEEWRPPPGDDPTLETVVMWGA